MLDVPGGDSATLAGVDGIELLAKVRALVDRLGIGVAQQKLRATMGVAQSGLERVVVGVGDGLVGGVFAVVRALTDAGALYGLTGAVGVGRIFAEGTAAVED